MNIAFYAPLKPPDHPNPSGDRLLARLFMTALERAGHRVSLASNLRSFEGAGNAVDQSAIRGAADTAAHQLIDRWRNGPAPDLWFSYHIYHKAPDWIGPRVSGALGIPYVIAEASVSPSQVGGPWRDGHEQARRCVARADAVVAINRRDVECTRPLLRADAKLLRLAPFIDSRAWPTPRRTKAPVDNVRIATVARMRRGDKARSWMMLADWIERLRTRGWTLDVVGDGDARVEIEDRLRACAGDRVRFHGRLEGDDLAAVLDGADLFVWPAFNEAFGMALLEAQSRGLAVFAGRNGGVPDVAAHGRAALLVDLADTAAAARQLDYLLARPAVIERMGRDGRTRVDACHSIDTAASALNRLVTELCPTSS